MSECQVLVFPAWTKGSQRGAKDPKPAFLTLAMHYSDHGIDPDQPLSQWAAYVTECPQMATELARRKQVASSVAELAFVVEGLGYRRAAALLLGVADDIENALICDPLPEGLAQPEEQG